MPLPSKHTVEISAFVREADIDPVYYERSYFLAPDKRAEKPYAMLLRALGEKELVATATITIRKKEQLCALRPREGTIMLATLYYPDEYHDRYREALSELIDAKLARKAG